MAYDADSTSLDTLTLTAEIVSSYLGNASHVQASDIPTIIKNVRAALSENSAPAPTEEATGPAPKMHGSQVKKSITPDHLISFIDNKPYKTLKRHLSRHGHDMKSYRDAYGLPNDYPSVSPNYSASRSEIAKKLGLGARRKAVAEEAAPKAAAPKRARKAAATPETAEA